MKIIIDVSGGLDACFENKKEFNIELPGDEVKVGQLIEAMCKMCNPKRLDFFVSQQSLRPGILVLINDVDWELEDKEEAILHNNDRVSFISTLHGG